MGPRRILFHGATSFFEKPVATQEILTILWNLKVHYRVHKSPPLASILNQIIQSRPHFISLRFILILSSHLCVSF
jgi:hypothetical protein